MSIPSLGGPSVALAKPSGNFPVAFNGDRLAQANSKKDEERQSSRAANEPAPAVTVLSEVSEPKRDEPSLAKAAAVDSGKETAPVLIVPVTIAAVSPAPRVDTAPVTRMRQDDALAVVIGITKYRGELPQADHAESDARLVAQYLHRTLGVPDANIKLLLGAEASKGDIDAALEEWLPAQARRPGVPIYFYFSGHGAPDPSTGDSYLVPYDGDPSYLKSKGLSVSRVYRSLAATKGRVLAMLDACFSGAGGHSVIPKGLRPLVAIHAVAPVEGTLAVLAASGAAEVTGSAPASPHGLFTYHLLRGLSGLADRDGDHQVSLHELSLFVTRAVTEDARRANREQTPTLSTSGVDKPGDWIVVEGLVE